VQGSIRLVSPQNRAKADATSSLWPAHSYEYAQNCYAVWIQTKTASHVAASLIAAISTVSLMIPTCAVSRTAILPADFRACRRRICCARGTQHTLLFQIVAIELNIPRIPVFLWRKGSSGVRNDCAKVVIISQFWTYFNRQGALSLPTRNLAEPLRRYSQSAVELTR
jgi:hypothetical protein